MEKLKTIQSVAKEISDNIVWAKRDNGQDYCYLKKDFEWQSAIMREAHLDRLPSDDVYDRIDTILDKLSDLDEEATQDDCYEAIQEIEPDCYTSDLTKWLNSNNENVYYLGEALDIGINDGFQLLAYAQQLYIQEIGNNLINAIQEYIDNLE